MLGDEVSDATLASLPLNVRELFEQHVEALPEAERQIERLTTAFDGPFANDPVTVAFMLLGIRCRTFHRGIVHSLEGPSPRSAEPTLRALIEANLLLRYFEQGYHEGNLEQRLGLWAAETERSRLAIHDDISRMDAAARARCEGGMLSESDRKRMREIVAAAQDAAITAEVRGAQTKGRLLPTTGQMVELLKGGATEAYTVGYRPLSAATHISEASFAGDYARDEQTISWSDDLPITRRVATRVFALTAYASALCPVSLICGLGFGDEADEVKRRFIPHDIPLADRLAPTP